MPDDDSPLLAAALAYAARGWPVFPCSPENKQPLTPKASAPAARDGGLYLASTDEAQIRQWWARWPRAMIGMPTGTRSGTLVVDLDPKQHSADAMLQGLKDWLGGAALPLCPLARTQSGGLHLYFRLPDEPLGNRANLFGKIADAPQAIASHVDVRADGGYVIVPPSLMASGKPYVWEMDPADYELPDCPPRLVDAIAKRLDGRPDHSGDINKMVPGSDVKPSLTPDDPVAKARHRYAMAALDREIGELAASGEGSRGFTLNKTGFSLGGLVGAGLLSETLVRAEIWGACERNGLVAKDGASLVQANIRRSMADGAASPIDITQIGARAGTSRTSRGAAAPRPQSSHPPSSFVRPPAPPDEGEGSDGSHVGSTAPEPPSKGGGGDGLDMECANLPLTDLGNAQRFTRRFGADFVFVPEWGWLAWDGKRWNNHEADAILNRAVHATVKAIAEEAHMIRLYAMAFDTEGTEHPLVNPVIDVKTNGKVVTFADKISGWCLASQSNSHLSCVARLAQAYLTASPDVFDADPMAFNVDNGTLRFAKRSDGAPYVRMTPHAREDMLTKIAPVTYDPKAECPVYDRFLARVQPDGDMRRHLHAWGGVSLTGLQLARLSFWYGTGRNGKSTLVDAWAHVMGDYAQTIPIESFLDQGRTRRGGEASPDIASLPGIRCLRTSEPEKGSKLAESLVKLVTGGEPLRARHLNRDFFEFRPFFKLTMQGNYKPRIDGTDEGIWARILLVPWTVMVPAEERDTALPDKLRAEASGILNRLLDGLTDYLDHGLSPTAEVLDATAEYREESDPIGRFIAECTRRIDEKGVARVEGGPFYKLYVSWAKANGERPFSPKAFSRGLQDHGIRRIKSSGIFYLGIETTKTTMDFEGKEFIDEPYRN